MTARRPLLTAATAGSVLFALWFVPSANAIVGIDGAKDSDGSGLRKDGSGLRTDSAPGTPKLDGGPGPTGRTGGGGAGSGSSPGSGSTAPRRFLADTGGPDTTPYLVGGAACLVLGAGLVGYSVRRTRGETH
ncbi:LAETG motif-containing sortase-dependent surface protein [Streptomyces sp. NPDC001339]|uniref:LAETG motif-containing sortase-dependent surface protein n=1 Tax=Streptomyces sp. NPDC001339 TaxID=3364563 RepID=UPI0036A53030